MGPRGWLHEKWSLYCEAEPRDPRDSFTRINACDTSDRAKIGTDRSTGNKTRNARIDIDAYGP